MSNVNNYYGGAGLYNPPPYNPPPYFDMNKPIYIDGTHITASMVMRFIQELENQRITAENGNGTRMGTIHQLQSQVESLTKKVEDLELENDLLKEELAFFKPKKEEEEEDGD